jgi:capsular polysaccharide transport system permease protein
MKKPSDGSGAESMPANPSPGQAPASPNAPGAGPAGQRPRVPEASQVPPAPQGGAKPGALVGRPAPRTPAGRSTSLAVSVDGRGLAKSAPLQVTPIAWAAEVLRIDVAAATRKRRRAFLSRMFVFVFLPTLLTAAYIFFYATPRYVSEFQITYQSVDLPNSGSPSSTAGGLSTLAATVLGTAGTNPLDMTRVLTAYLNSDSLLKRVDKELNLRAHYGNPNVDWLDRLGANSSEEDFLYYFTNRRITVNDMMGGYLVIDVEAFDPKYAVAVATAMTKAADDMVEKLTTRARVEELRVAEVELKKTQDRLIKATTEVTKFRNEHVDFNPTTMAGQLDTVVGGLETQLSTARAELAHDRSFLSENSPQIFSLKSQIVAMEQQVAAEKLRLATTEAISTSNNGGPAKLQAMPYSQTVADYTALQLEQTFATDSYVSAKQGYDTAVANLALKENYVESFVEPNLPQDATSPDPWYYIPGAFMVSLILYAIGSMMIGSFRDQAGV